MKKLLVGTGWCAHKEGHNDPRRSARQNEPSFFYDYWDYQEPDRKIHTYIWLREWDYLVILRKRRLDIGEVAFIVTAFHVDGPSTRKKLEKKLSGKIA